MARKPHRHIGMKRTRKKQKPLAAQERKTHTAHESGQLECFLHILIFISFQRHHYHFFYIVFFVHKI